jgi:hypothetical protein
VLEKQTAPIGVLLVIFEARPDALPQIAALALRSGNGLLLKGGKEAARSNAALHRVIVDAIGAGLGPDLIALVTSRDEISDLLKLHDVIDLVIPRGSNELVSHIQVRQSRRQGGGGGGQAQAGGCRRAAAAGGARRRRRLLAAGGTANRRCRRAAERAPGPKQQWLGATAYGIRFAPSPPPWPLQLRASPPSTSAPQANTKIPVLGHADGICHIYVHPKADMAKATKIVADAKADYPAACNAVEKVGWFSGARR